jgi:predicted anti-sigma-YlaC factor YlaD
MTDAMSCGDIRQALGVYVVGAIDPAERATVDEHLTHCSDCTQELAGLAGLPALLGRVPLTDAERLARDGAGLEPQDEPRPELLDSLLRRVTVRRRALRWRGIAAAAAAAVIAVAGGVAVGLAASHASDHAYQQEAYGSNARTHVTAAVSYQSTSWGTAMRVQVTGIRTGVDCKFWVVNSRGQRSVAGGWIVARDYPDQWYPASSPVALGKVRSFEITWDGRVLVTIPA